MSAHGGQPFLTAYSTSKGGLVTFTKSVAHSLRHDQIRGNAINMDWCETPGEHAIQAKDGNDPATWLASGDANQPFGRILRPRDVSNLAIFMLSNQSAPMMTGAIVD